jgi:hypothetical protein
MRKFCVLALVVGTIIVIAAGLTATASAKSVNTTAVAAPKTANDNTPVTVDSHTSTQSITVGKASFTGQEWANGQVTVLADMMIKGVKVTSKNCFWTKKGQKWWNGGYGPNGTQYELETVPGYLCHKGKMLVKVAGGHTGRRCFNEARLAKPANVVKGRVIWVSNNATVRMHLRAHEAFSIHAVCGTASGDATAETWVYLRAVMRTRGSVVSQFFANVTGKAWAKATGKLDCVPVVPPPAQVCTDRNATNYGGPLPCQYPTPVCTDRSATNYGGPLPCQYPTPVCTDRNATNYGGPLPCQYPPANRPPTGTLKVPQHLIAGGAAGKVSVDGVMDLDGDAVKVTFLFKDKDGNTLNLATGPTFTDGPGVISQMINPPKTPMNVYVYATLDDGKANGSVTLPVGSFPVVADPDPGK